MIEKIDIKQNKRMRLQGRLSPGNDINFLKTFRELALVLSTNLCVCCIPTCCFFHQIVSHTPAKQSYRDKQVMTVSVRTTFEFSFPFSAGGLESELYLAPSSSWESKFRVPYDVTAASSRDQTSVSHAWNYCHHLCDIRHILRSVSPSVKVNSRGRTVLMLTISNDKAVLLRFSHVDYRSHQKFLRINATWDSKSSHPRKMEELSLEIPTQTIPHCEPSKHPDLQFDRLQPSDEDLDQEKKLEFGQFVAREAALDEEYWTAAWLRAESHWEERKNDRFAESNKRKFADQEFNAIKRRTNGQQRQTCTCIITVKKDTKHVKRTVVKSVVGTLDLSIRYLLDGETFPGERVNAPLFCSINRTLSSKYGYISNLCVAKAARRQGIASNMLQLAIRSAMLNADVEQIYVHVHKENKPAQELYRKLGFEIIEGASSQLSEEQTYLLCFKA